MKDSKLFSKLKSIKHLDLVVILILCAIFVLIIMSSWGGGLKNQPQQANKLEASNIVVQLEDRLRNTLSAIKDVGNVDVMITYDGEIEYVYAKDEETKQNSVTSGGSTTTTTSSKATMIFDGNSPIVVKEILPNILGVVVIATGAGDTGVKLSIIRAVETLLNVPGARIEVLVGN